jgi:hypothetical protein
MTYLAIKRNDLDLLNNQIEERKRIEHFLHAFNDSYMSFLIKIDGPRGKKQ